MTAIDVLVPRFVPNTAASDPGESLLSKEDAFTTPVMTGVWARSAPVSRRAKERNRMRYPRIGSITPTAVVAAAVAPLPVPPGQDQRQSPADAPSLPYPAPVVRARRPRGAAQRVPYILRVLEAHRRSRGRRRPGRGG